VGLYIQVAVPNPLDGLRRSADAAKKAAPQAVQVPLPGCFATGVCLQNGCRQLHGWKGLHLTQQHPASVLSAAQQTGPTRGSEDRCGS
jgi:hypothetical protein